MDGFTIWLTGLPGAGKTSLALAVADILRHQGYKVEVLDGDAMRANLSKGLGYSKQDRDDNIRRIGFVCHLLSRNSVVAIAAAVSPYRQARDENRALIGRFVEVYVKCPLEVLIQRDVKGLYAKALKGEVANFTGISDPYEEPLNPEFVVNTNIETPKDSTSKIIARLVELGYTAPSSWSGPRGHQPASASGDAAARRS